MKCPYCGSEMYSVKESHYTYKRCKCDDCHKYFYSLDDEKAVKIELEKNKKDDLQLTYIYGDL